MASSSSIVNSSSGTLRCSLVCSSSSLRLSSSPSFFSNFSLHSCCAFHSSLSFSASPSLSPINPTLLPPSLLLYGHLLSCTPSVSSVAGPFVSSSSQKPFGRGALPASKHATLLDPTEHRVSSGADDDYSQQLLLGSASKSSEVHGAAEGGFNQRGKTLLSIDGRLESRDEGDIGAVVEVFAEIGLTQEKILKVRSSNPNLFNTISGPELVAGIQTLGGFGMSKADIAGFVEQFPSLLLNLDEKFTPLLQLFDSVGIEKKTVLGKLLKFNAARVASSAEWSIRRFFDFCSGYNISMVDAAESMSKYPQIAIFSSDNMYRVAEFMKEFDMTDKEIGMVIKQHPQILTRNVDNNLKPKVNLLMEFGVDKKGISSVMTKQPQLFGSSLEKSLKPKLMYLQSVGFKKQDIANLVINYPTVMARSVTGSLVEKGELLLSLGFEKGSLHFCRTMRYALAASSDYLERRLSFFSCAGFSQEDIFIMLRSNPCLLLKNEAQLQAKMEFLVNEMHYPLKALVVHPLFLNLSMEKRIKPRHRVLVWLKSKGILGKDPSLCFFTCLSDERFQKKYVNCHPGCSLAFEGEQVDLACSSMSGINMLSIADV